MWEFGYASLLQAERRRCEARRAKVTHENCTLPTIHLGPAGRRPAWAYDDYDDDEDWHGDCDNNNDCLGSLVYKVMMMMLKVMVTMNMLINKEVVAQHFLLHVKG